MREIMLVPLLDDDGDGDGDGGGDGDGDGEIVRAGDDDEMMAIYGRMGYRNG